MFTKKDLKSGDHIVLRNKKEYVIFRDSPIGEIVTEVPAPSDNKSAFLSLGSFSECLKYKEPDDKERSEQLENDNDIVFVKRPVNGFNLLDKLTVYRTMYERQGA